MRIFGSERLDSMLRQARHEGRRGDHPPVGEQGAGEGAGQGRGAQLRHPQEPAEVRRRDERPAQGDLRASAARSWRRRTSPTSSRDMRQQVVEDLVDRARPAQGLCRPVGHRGPGRRRSQRSSASSCRSPPGPTRRASTTRTIRERLTEATDEQMAAKAARYGAETMRTIEKQVLLQTIDQQLARAPASPSTTCAASSASAATPSATR